MTLNAVDRYDDMSARRPFQTVFLQPESTVYRGKTLVFLLGAFLPVKRLSARTKHCINITVPDQTAPCSLSSLINDSMFAVFSKLFIHNKNGKFAA